MFNIHQLIGQPWAILPEIAEHAHELLQAEGFAGLRRLAELRVAVQASVAASEQVSFASVAPGAEGRIEKLEASAIQAAAPGGRAGAAVAIIPVMGMLTMRGDVIDCMRTTSAINVGEAVKSAAMNQAVSAIVLDIDSPGGQVLGIPELAATIRDARKAKPVVTFADGMMASAAYWVGAQADEIIATVSGLLGSIGVYTMHTDRSGELATAGKKVTLAYAGKYKTEGHPYGPITDEAMATMQGEVDRYYAMFTADVARGRGVGVDDVRGGFGQGRVVGAKQAVDQGMANAVGTLDDAIRRAAQLAAERRRQSGAAAIAAMQLDVYRRERA